MSFDMAGSRAYKQERIICEYLSTRILEEY